MILICIVKGYVFGNVNKLSKDQLYQLAKDTDESALGYTIMQAMESDMFKELQEEEN